MEGPRVLDPEREIDTTRVAAPRPDARERPPTVVSSQVPATAHGRGRTLASTSVAERRPTLASVAAAAGVSVSTASLAFSGSGPVSDATRERVLSAARDLRYAGPDPRGRSLRQGRSAIVAVAMEETVRYAFRDPVKIAFLDGIATEIAQRGLALLVLPDLGAGSATVANASMDGAVLIGCSPSAAQSVEIGRRRSIPMVSLGGAAFTDVLSVTLDDREATVTLAHHLQSLGHRRVAVVALPIDGSGTRGPLTSDLEVGGSVLVTIHRLAGVREVFGDVPVWIGAGSLVEEGRAAGRALLTGGAPNADSSALLDLDRRPTAIIAQSDLLAAGVILAAEDLGLRVPEDLSVVGFDGVRTDTVIPHDLTTMVQPATEQGQTAARLLLELMAGENPESRHFTSRFHRGGTTAPPLGMRDVSR